MKFFISKKVAYIALFGIALQTTAIHPIENPFKKIGSAISDATSKAEKTLQDLGKKTIQKLDEYSSLGLPKMISTLRSQVGKLKGQFKEFGGRIITGDLSTGDKIVVSATIISVVTLTALVTGVSLIKIKKEQEAAIEKKAKEISEKTASGIKGIFEKAKNRLNEFDSSLKSLAECLKKRKCSQNQKKFLYGTAITIAALTLLAIGIGVGAFFYKKHKDQRAAEQESSNQAVERDEAAISDSVLRGYINKANEKFQASKEKVSNFFVSIAQEKGDSPIQKAATNIDALLQEAKSNASSALQTVGEKRADLAFAAKQKFEAAKKAATDFISQATSSGKEFFATGISQVLSINANSVRDAIDTVKLASGKLVNQAKKTYESNVVRRLTSLMSELTKLQASLSNVQANKTATLKELGWYQANYDLQTLPLAQDFKKVWDGLPLIINQVNELRLTPLGYLVKGVMTGAAKVVNAVESINTIPIAGKILISDKLKTFLEELSNHIRALGESIKEALSHTTIITAFPSTTGGVVSTGAMSFLKNLRSINIFTNLNEKNTQLYDTLYDKIPLVDAELSEGTKQLDEASKTILESIKAGFITLVVKNPLLIKDAPQYLAQQFGTLVKVMKQKLGFVIDKKNELVVLYGRLMQQMNDLLTAVNQSFGGDIEINPDITRQLSFMGLIIKNISKSISKIKAEVKNTYLPF